MERRLNDALGNDRAQRPRLVRMRLAWSTGALLAVARRWAAFLLVSIAVLGIGYFVAAIGWPAMPVLWASSLPSPEGLAVMVLHSGAATLLAWGLREALLPGHWLLAERALPLEWQQRSTADLAVIALAQSPLFALYACSLLSWWQADPAWLRGHWPRGLAFMAGSVALSLASAAGLLALRRKQPRPRGRQDLTLAGRTRLAPRTALILLPLWRGPARSVLTTLVITALGLGACLLGAALSASEPRWWLAAYAGVAMLGCTRAHALAHRELGPLLAASRHLPLPQRFGPRALGLLALAPVLLAWPLLLTLILSGPWRLAPMAAPLYLLAALIAPALQLSAPSAQTEPRAARWMLCLVLWVALATEILK